MRNYGYKVCYKQFGKNKLKMYLVTNTYDLATWLVRWYEQKPPKDKKTDQPIEHADWLVVPVKTFIEYKRLWRNCPFHP